MRNRFFGFLFATAAVICLAASQSAAGDALPPEPAVSLDAPSVASPEPETEAPPLDEFPFSEEDSADAADADADVAEADADVADADAFPLLPPSEELSPEDAPWSEEEADTLAVFAEEACWEGEFPRLPAFPENGAAEAGPVAPPSVSDGEAAPSDAGLSPFRPVPERPEVSRVLGRLTGASRKNVQVGISRSSRYIPMIRGILEQMELPLELISLPLVESNFSPRARSRAGAVGLWQFMARTARASGLRVDWWVDERLDPPAATRAAARHLKELYERFGDWELVLAAYNAGAGGVRRALKAQKADDFWDLVGTRRLRRETQQYVPSFYAAMMILEEPEKFGFAPGPEEPPPEAETVWVDSPVDLMTVARLAGADFDAVCSLNPALLRGCTPPGTDRFALNVPAGTAEKVTERLRELSDEERLDFVRHRVVRGDTLWDIARRYRTDLRSIREINRFKKKEVLRIGRQIVVPVRRAPSRKGARDETATAGAGGGTYHVVEPGDTLFALARATGATVEELVRWNGLDRGGLIRPGQRLWTSPPSSVVVTASAPSAEVHVVRRGETAWSIARASGVAVNDLLRWNGLRARSTIRPGDRLRLSPMTD